MFLQAAAGCSFAEAAAEAAVEALEMVDKQ